MLKRAVAAAFAVCLAATAGSALAQSAPPAGAGCGPEIAAPATAAARAQMEANTKKIALAFVSGTVEAQDKLLAPNALFWALGIGYLDRSQYVALHSPKTGPSRGAPTGHKQTINHVIVQNDLATVDMENLVSWPDFTYDQKYNTLIQVRGDKICLLKIFSDSSMAKKMLPDIDKSVSKQ
jgi:hypothetical protein